MVEVFCEDFCVVFFLLPDHFVQHALAQTTLPDFALNFFAPQCLHFAAEHAFDSTTVISPERFVHWCADTLSRQCLLIVLITEETEGCDTIFPVFLSIPESTTMRTNFSVGWFREKISVLPFGFFLCCRNFPLFSVALITVTLILILPKLPQARYHIQRFGAAPLHTN